MGMVQEFKEFALKGSVMDLAVGVIIGGAFGKIVDSVVNDLIMPVVSRFTGGLDFSNLFIPLRDLPPDMPGVRVRALHHRRHQFRHPGVHHLSDGQGHEPAEEELAAPAGRNAGGCGPAARDS